ncbi:beta-glucoside-specific PTS transporter subunit IIABC [Blautia schinkii]|nr:beta-glucoside-specific PTS transporter subunit IIABC [Blautia schinkii]
MDCKKLAAEILKEVGGEDNITFLTHCATRLRFNLKDASVIKLDAIKELKGVFGAVYKGDQLQIIIGNEVANVHKQLQDMIHISGEESPKSKKKISLGMIFETISGIFVPLIPAIAGCGLLKAFLGLFVAFGWADTASSTYAFVELAADSAFYFLPVLLAVSSSKKFHASTFISVVLACAMLHPNFVAMNSAGESVSLFGLPVTLIPYSSTVIPIILIVMIQSYVEKLLNKIIPKILKLILVPVLIILIMLPVTFVVIGPLGAIIGTILSGFLTMLDSLGAWIVPLIFGAFCPLLVMTGMHYGFYPLVFTQIADLGYTTLLPAMLPSNSAQGAACLAIALKSKKPEEKELSFSVGFTALAAGISEPALYGVTLKNKVALFAVMAGGAAGGLYYGLTQVHTFAPTAVGLLAFPAYVDANVPYNLIHMLIGAGIAVAIAFIGTFIFYKEDKQQNISAKEEPTSGNGTLLKEKEIISSPLCGRVIPLAQVDDETFSSEMMGKGIAVLPCQNKLVSPVDGIVSMIFETKHAIGLTSDSGVEVLIHIGIDTVELKGEHFKALIEDGARVKKGDALIEFDSQAIKEKGYDLTTMLIITNTEDYTDITATKAEEVGYRDDLLTII